MRDNKAIGTLAALVALGSILTIVICLAGVFGPRVDSAQPRAVGRVLAERTLSLLKPGGLVTVLTRDTTAFQNPASDILLGSFRKTLAKAGVKIDSIQTLQVDPLRPVAVPAGDFFQWINSAAKGSVIVSLMGPPVLSEAQSARLGEVKPAIIAFCPGPVRDQVDLGSLFSRGLLKAAVVGKRRVAAQRHANVGEREAFDRQFFEVTPTNLNGLSTNSNLEP